MELPALRHIPQDKWELAEAVVHELWTPNGIKSVSPSFLTGKVLVTYDATELHEESVLGFIEGMIGFTVSNWNCLSKIPPEDLPVIIARLRQSLQSSNHSAQVLNEEVSIPDDICS